MPQKLVVLAAYAVQALREPRARGKKLAIVYYKFELVAGPQIGTAGPLGRTDFLAWQFNFPLAGRLEVPKDLDLLRHSNVKLQLYVVNSLCALGLPDDGLHKSLNADNVLKHQVSQLGLEQLTQGMGYAE